MYTRVRARAHTYTTYTRSRSETRGDHMSFVYFEIVISTCLTHKPVPYRKFFYLPPPSLSCHYTAVLFLSALPCCDRLSTRKVFSLVPFRGDCYTCERPFTENEIRRWKREKNAPSVKTYQRDECEVWVWSINPTCVLPRIETLIRAIRRENSVGTDVLALIDVVAMR